MRILLIASFPDSVLVFRGELIEAWVKAGCEVHVAAPCFGELSLFSEMIEAKGATLHSIPLDRTGRRPLADIVLLFSLYRLCRTLRPDAVLPYTIKPVVYGTLAAWVARVPQRYALITGLGYAFMDNRINVVAQLMRWLYRVALARSNKVFFQNQDDERLFREMMILRHDVPSVVVNGSGVNVEEYSVVALPPGAPVFLMIGRLLGDKGVREYIEAARRVQVVCPGVRFLLVGWVDENPDAIAQEELDCWVSEGVIDFLGRLQDVRPAIASSTVYVLPSYREGTPRTVLEAMAMGRPIITTDAPGCRETVVDGVNGWTVKVRSVDALVNAMLKLIEDPSLAQRMGKRSRQIAEERYDVHKVNEIMLREMGITPAPQSGTRSHA